MKLRIRGNSIRLRLTQSEVEKVKSDGLVEEKTEFPNQSFVYALSAMSEINKPLAEFSKGKLEILIPKSTAENWAVSNEVGIYGNYENLQISVEKDFKCLTPRNEDEDADTFPHPKENC